MAVTRLTRTGRAPNRPRVTSLSSKADPGLIPEDAKEIELKIKGRSVRLTNLQKLFWPEEGIRKGDLLRYYAQISPVLLPHLKDRAMVMKRYPNGAAGPFFFQKRAPEPRPTG
jgi:bifunctional non-homologous end joining protein LigD